MSRKPRKDSKGIALRTGEQERKDGRYSYTWTDSCKRVRVVYAQTLLELRKKEKQLVQDLADGVATYEADQITVNQMWAKYIGQKYELKPTTRTNYMYIYDHFVSDSFGRMRLGKVKYTHVKSFYHDLMEKKGLEVATLDNINTLLHPTFQLAIRDGLIRTNPTEGVMNEIKKANAGWKKRRHALTVEQQRAFINFIDNHPVYEGWYPIIVTMLGTGMRVGETVGLRWEDVDFTKRVISVNHNLIYRPIDGKCRFIITSTKTANGVREIPMIDEVFDALLREYQVQKCTGGNTSVIDGYSGFIFTSAEGTVYIPTEINRAIRRIVDDYNSQEEAAAKKEKREPELLPYFSNHILRHTFCSRLCENETNVKIIQEIMGHSDIQTTLDIYAECSPQKKQEALKSLDGKIIIR